MKYIELEKVLEYEQPTKYIVNDTQYSNYDEEHTTPVLTAGQTFILGYTNEKNGIYKASIKPVIIFDDFTSASRYVDFDFKVKSSAMKILHLMGKNNIKYIYYAMQNIKFDSSTHKRYWISEYSKLKITEREKEEQDKIVSFLDTIIEAINNRKSMINDLNKLLTSKFNSIYSSNNYDKAPLGTLVDVRDGTHDSPSFINNSEYVLITSKNIKDDTIDFEGAKFISKEDYDNINTRSKVEANDILMPMIGTIGRPIIVRSITTKYAIKNVALFKESKKLLPDFLYSLLKSYHFKYYSDVNSRGGTQKFLSLSDIRNMEINNVPLPIQEDYSILFRNIEYQKQILQQDVNNLESLYNSKMHEFFD